MMSIQGPLWTWRKMEFRRKRGTAEPRLKGGGPGRARPFHREEHGDRAEQAHRAMLGKVFQAKGFSLCPEREKGVPLEDC